ncbi:MAG: hypothetical protein KDD44_06930, partial [Bdellovibrionales bacterium]|nr:hypothetical protein [Bdellovibrionales bacterium]
MTRAAPRGSRPDTKPRVIFFDADDTLFRLSDSFGTLYANLCASHGVTICPNHIDSHVEAIWA